MILTHGLLGGIALQRGAGNAAVAVGVGVCDHPGRVEATVRLGGRVWKGVRT
jgi:hypothetical protein